MARPTYKEFMRHTGEKPKRSALDCTTSLAQGVYFKDRQMNRDTKGSTPNPVRPDEGFGPDGKTVHIFHHRDRD